MEEFKDNRVGRGAQKDGCGRGSSLEDSQGPGKETDGPGDIVGMGTAMRTWLRAQQKQGSLGGGQPLWK